MKYFASCFFLLLASLNFAQDKWINYTNNFTVTDVLETEQGFYLASSGGLCQYDEGTGDEVYFNRGNSNLPSNQVNDLLLDSAGDLWITTSLGICKMNNGDFERGPTKLRGIMRNTLDNKIVIANYDSMYIQREGMNFDKIAYPATVAAIGGFEVDKETGAIYFNAVNYFAETYVAQWKDDEWTILFSDFIYESAITLTPQNQLLLINTSGLFDFENGNWNLITEVEDNDGFAPFGMFVNKDDEIIISYNSQCPKLQKWDGNTLSKIDFIRDDCEDVRFISPSKLNSDLYFAHNQENGFYTFSASTINEYQAFSQSPLRGNGVKQTLHPKDSTHYIIYQDQIQQIKSGNWFDIPLPAEISGFIRTADLDPEDNLWIHDISVLWKRENNAWIKINPPSEITDAIDLMEIGPDGEVWIQSRLNIARFQDSEWEVFKTIDHGLTSSIIQDLQVDPSNGDLWVSGFQGVRKFDGQNWIPFEIGPINHMFRSAIGPEGIFVNFNYGIANIKDNQVDTFSKSADGYFGTFNAELIFEQSEEKLYITGTDILGAYHEQQWQTYSTLNSGMYNGSSNDISIDLRGNIWMSGSGGGIAIFHPEGIILSNRPVPYNFSSSIKIFPTLLRGNEIYIQNEKEGEYQIVISDSIGRILMNRKQYLHSNETNTVQLPRFSRGLVLFVTLRNGETTATQKVITDPGN